MIGKFRAAIPRIRHIPFDLLTSDIMSAICKLNIEGQNVVTHCKDRGKDTVIQNLYIDTAPCCAPSRACRAKYTPAACAI